MWKKILVPHDFSELGEKAVQLGSKLAAHHGAELVLLHVTDLAGELPADARVAPGGEPEAARADAYTERGARRWLEKIARGVGGAHPVRCEVAFGDAADCILATAEEQKVDAIVMGTHGRTGLAHVVLGSIAEYVLRRANVPVVVCRGAASEPHRTREEKAMEDELAG